MIRTSFNADWLYHKDGSDAKIAVTLPHDAMIHDERSADSPGKDPNGYFVGGKYIYEKEFDVPADYADRHVEIAFGGVYKNTTVYINGEKAGYRPYGYVPFSVDCDAFIKPGEKNTILVEADNSKLPNSRWYSGGGIYRNVYMVTGGKSYIKYEGVRVTPVSIAPATVNVKMQIVGEGDVKVEILDKGAVIASAEGCDVTIEIPDGKLWSETDPYLYGYRVTMTVDGEVVDTEEGTFGVRMLEWNNTGLYVNGKRTTLKGACIHHDNGVVGSATFYKSEERRIRLLKESGYNAIRMSHHPASYELLEACDKLGMYIMDETFDMWYQQKNAYDYHLDFNEWYEADTLAMINKDYNHPSVILYSIGNEVSEPAKPEGVEAGKKLINICHREDPSRAVTGGINLMIISMAAKGKGLYDEGGAAAKAASGDNKKPDKPGKESKSGSLMFNTMMTMMGSFMTKAANSDQADKATSPILDALDIAGYNYASGRYPLEAKKHPNRVVVGSETFPQDIYKNWKYVETLPYVVGDFMWVGWDYLGEAAIGAWNYDGVSMANVHYPWILAGSGAYNIVGRPDAEAAYANIVWGATDAYIGVRPLNHPGVRVSKSAWRGTDAFDSWAWKNCEGNKTIVEVYGRGVTAELYLNGRKLGSRKLKEYKALFKNVAYEAGTLEAVILDAAGKELSRTSLESATGKSILTAVPEEQEIKVGDVVYIPVEIRGENGVMESNDDRTVSVKVEGGVLEGFGSANPAPTERYDDAKFTTFYGQAMAVVRALKPGEIKLTASADGMEDAVAVVKVVE